MKSADKVVRRCVTVAETAVAKNDKAARLEVTSSADVVASARTFSSLVGPAALLSAASLSFGQ